MLPTRNFSLACAVALAAVAAGCGSGSGSKSTNTSAVSQSAGTSSTPSAGALSADARSAATGDVPDNQIFLVYTDSAAGFAMKYPEGWTQSGRSRAVTFRDKNNLVRVVVSAGGSAPTPAKVAADLNALKSSDPTLTYQPPQLIRLPAGSAIKATYTTESAPNPVTGKRVKLIVDRYVLASAGRVATVDLGTPVGVDNVDAYRMMIKSFRWL